MQTLEKKLNFEQLNDEKFENMNLQETEKIVGGQFAKKHRCATCYSNGKNKANDKDKGEDNLS